MSRQIHARHLAFVFVFSVDIKHRNVRGIHILLRLGLTLPAGLDLQLMIDLLRVLERLTDGLRLLRGHPGGVALLIQDADMHASLILHDLDHCPFGFGDGVDKLPLAGIRLIGHRGECKKEKGQSGKGEFFHPLILPTTLAQSSKNQGRLPQGWESVQPALIPIPRRIAHLRRLRVKVQPDHAGWPVALLSDDNLGHAIGDVRAVLLRRVVVRPVRQHHDIRILLNGPGLTQVAHLRTVALSVLGLPIKLAQQDHADVKLAGQHLKPTAHRGDALLAAVGLVKGQQLQVVDEDRLNTTGQYGLSGHRPQPHQRQARRAP